jgi:hypothetical protein
MKYENERPGRRDAIVKKSQRLLLLALGALQQIPTTLTNALLGTAR